LHLPPVSYGTSALSSILCEECSLKISREQSSEENYLELREMKHEMKG
jgi:hypothetical protein